MAKLFSPNVLSFLTLYSFAELGLEVVEMSGDLDLGTRLANANLLVWPWSRLGCGA